MSLAIPKRFGRHLLTTFLNQNEYIIVSAEKSTQLIKTVTFKNCRNKRIAQ
jgi:prophage maintenance system killer protein